MATIGIASAQGMSTAMQNKSQRDPLLVAIVGPTASGKTALSLAVAEKFSGEIVSCDSVAVYRELEIGSAKPTAAERARVPHHLLDIASPLDSYTAGDFSRDARNAINEIGDRKRMPIIAGGTGLYLRSLIDGLFSGPQRNDALRDELRAAAEAKGPESLHARLVVLDPASAEKIHPNDTPKIIRALEVCLAIDKPMSEAWLQGRNPLTGFRILRIGLDPPREQLKERINERAAAMFANGLVEETRGLVARYGENCRALTTLGYAQCVSLLRGDITEKEAIVSAQLGHRQYAKRQRTWFRREPDVRWLYNFGSEPDMVASALRMVETALLPDQKTGLMRYR
jgi:tRNA dimethylallyltransferase